MRWKRRTVVLGVNLLAAAVAAGSLGGCIGFATRYSLQRLHGPAAPAVLPIHQVSSVRFGTTEDGKAMVELEVLLTGDEATTLRAEAEGDDPPKRELLQRSLQRAPLLFYGAHSFFPVATPVRPVDADGRIAARAAPLTESERAAGILLALVEGPDHRWCLRVHVPPDGGRAADQPLSMMPSLSFTFARPGSAVARVTTGVLLYLPAFAFDAVTWPVQLVVYLWILKGVGGH